MTWTHAILLGLLQGLTEFLPVSSTAHMDFVPQLFGQPDPGATFSAIVQLGPILAIIWYFRADLSRYLQGILRTIRPKAGENLRSDVDARLGWYTLIGTVPLAVAGLALEKYVDNHFRLLNVVAVFLIVFGLILLVAEMLGKKTETLEHLSFGQAVFIGFAQVFALVPGASRSGCTISAGLFAGLKREDAARFSFLLSIPAITGAGAYKLLKALRTEGLHGNLPMYLFASFVACVFAYLAVRWFMAYVERHDTRGFVVYRIVLGLVLLILLNRGVIENRYKAPAEPAQNATRTSLAR